VTCGRAGAEAARCDERLSGKKQRNVGMPPAEDRTRSKVPRIVCQRCGKAAHVLFDGSPHFILVCTACRDQVAEEQGRDRKRTDGTGRSWPGADADAPFKSRL